MTGRDTTGGRVVVWAQGVLLAAYLLGSFGVLLLAVVQTGDAGALLDPRLERLGDPKDSMPQSLWNPFAWLLAICRLVAMLVFMAAIGGLVLGLGAIARSQRVGDRRMVRWSLTLTAAWLAVLIVAVTPYGQQMHTWLLD